MPTIGTDFEGFRQMSAEFYRACPALDSDGLDNGFKCLGLAYLGVSFAEGPRGAFQRDYEAPLIMRLAREARLTREAQLKSEALH